MSNLDAFFSKVYRCVAGGRRRGGAGVACTPPAETYMHLHPPHTHTQPPVCRYWHEKGFLNILVGRLLNLAALGFTLVFSAFLLLAVDWRALRCASGMMEALVGCVWGGRQQGGHARGE